MPVTEKIITSTLDFVGEEPKHAPFEKTQTINGNKIEYTVKGIPAGTTVQFKLSIFKNGNLVLEGLSNKVTIKGKNNLTIGLDKITNWIVIYYDKHYCFGIDTNATPIDDTTFENMGDNPNAIGIDFIDPWNDQNRTTEFRGSCMDDKDNVYVISYEFGDLKLYRLRPPYKTPVLLCDVEDDTFYTLKYDTATDCLYLFNQGTYNYYHRIPNVSTITETISSFDELEITLDTPEYILPGYSSFNSDNEIFSIYNNELYWIKIPTVSENAPGAVICKTISGGIKSESLYQYDQNENSFKGFIVEEMGTSYSDTGNGGFNAEITDLSVTKEGVFALVRDQYSYYFDNTSVEDAKISYQASRGGVVKLNHNLTSAKLYGWTTSQRVIKVENGTSKYENRMYLPKNLKAGFYGPTEILAVKPKKLIFTDLGGWVYLDEDNNVLQMLGYSKNIIIFDLESCTYSSIPVDSNDPPIFSPDSLYHDWSKFESSEYLITETWQ